MERDGKTRNHVDEEATVTAPTMQLPDKLWLTIPEAGALFNLKPAASYNAANRGELPTIKVGGKKVVPTAKLKDMLGLSE